MSVEFDVALNYYILYILFRNSSQNKSSFFSEFPPQIKHLIYLGNFLMKWFTKNTRGSLRLLRAAYPWKKY